MGICGNKAVAAVCYQRRERGCTEVGMHIRLMAQYGEDSSLWYTEWVDRGRLFTQHSNFSKSLRFVRDSCFQSTNVRVPASRSSAVELCDGLVQEKWQEVGGSIVDQDEAIMKIVDMWVTIHARACHNL